MGKTRDLFKKIRDTKGTFHAKMSSIKDRNGMDLTEAEDTKQRWQEYTEELYKKDLHDPDNHNGVITHLEPDILECEVRWYSHLFQNFPQFIVIHTVKGFGTVNKAEIDVFLELSCFFQDPADVGNLISGSSAFSKTSLNIWKFTVHVLLKPGLENFEHYFTSM
jgi:hypothetical protein